jgi:hypothetical protein
MTRARALKEVIRARAAKTGERYTSARRHVLQEVRPRPAARVDRPASDAGALATDKSSAVAPAAAMATPRSSLPPATSKGGVSDAKSREKTGHGLDHWFDVLDRFGAVGKGHTASARHLFDVHKVPGWYSQGITVAYERARGVRAQNQRCDGVYEVSVSKVVSATTLDVVKAFTDARVRRRWTKAADAHLSKALAAALDSPASKGIVVRPAGLGQYRYKWGDTSVQLYLVPKGEGKASVVITNSKLAQTAMVEERRAKWRAALDGLAQYFGASKKPPA